MGGSIQVSRLVHQLIKQTLMMTVIMMHRGRRGKHLRGADDASSRCGIIEEDAVAEEGTMDGPDMTMLFADIAIAAAVALVMTELQEFGPQLQDLLRQGPLVLLQLRDALAQLASLLDQLRSGHFQVPHVAPLALPARLSALTVLEHARQWLDAILGLERQAHHADYRTSTK
jgi:hypothetical protein